MEPETRHLPHQDIWLLQQNLWPLWQHKNLLRMSSIAHQIFQIDNFVLYKTQFFSKNTEKSITIYNFLILISTIFINLIYKPRKRFSDQVALHTRWEQRWSYFNTKHNHMIHIHTVSMLRIKLVWMNIFNQSVPDTFEFRLVFAVEYAVVIIISSPSSWWANATEIR